MTPPGEMRTQVVYQRPVRTKDGLGQTRLTWEDVFTCFAAVRPLSAREIYYAQSTRSETTHRVAMRWRPEVDSKGRFVLARNPDRIFNIFSVINTDELDAELVILAAEAT